MKRYGQQQSLSVDRVAFVLRAQQSAAMRLKDNATFGPTIGVLYLLGQMREREKERKYVRIM